MGESKGISDAHLVSKIVLIAFASLLLDGAGAVGIARSFTPFSNR